MSCFMRLLRIFVKFYVTVFNAVSIFWKKETYRYLREGAKMLDNIVVNDPLYSGSIKQFSLSLSVYRENKFVFLLTLACVELSYAI